MTICLKKLSKSHVKIKILKNNFHIAIPGAITHQHNFYYHNPWRYIIFKLKEHIYLEIHFKYYIATNHYTYIFSAI